MITLYHLGVSQSDRIVWLLEELGLEYQLEWFDRGSDGLAPPEYCALHPVATAPIIKDGDTVLAESGAICEYLSRRYANGALSVDAGAENFADYLYWMQINNHLQGLVFTRLAGAEQSEKNALVLKAMARREEAFYQYMEQRLSRHDYIAGDDFTCADIMLLFNLTTMPMIGGRTVDDLPNVKSYVERLCARPAYQKAMVIAGPAASRPEK